MAPKTFLFLKELGVDSNFIQVFGEEWLDLTILLRKGISSSNITTAVRKRLKSEQSYSFSKSRGRTCEILCVHQTSFEETAKMKSQAVKQPQKGIYKKWG